MSLSDPFSSYRLLAAELSRLDYSTTTFHKKEQLVVRYTSPEGKYWETAAAHIKYPFNDDSVGLLSIDKSKAYEYASKKSIPVPFTKEISLGQTIGVQELQRVIDTSAPLIVKPNDSSLSKGLTRNITSLDELESACEYARSIKNSKILIQEQVHGDEVRFIIMGGRVKAALLRQTPRVIGDGSSSIADLIKAENNDRSKLVYPYITYPILDNKMIDKQILGRSDEVLKNGELLELSRTSMIKEGCSVYEILDRVHPGYVEEVERLVGELNAGFMAVDYLIGNYEQAPGIKDHWFLEFNTSPVLKLCYGCRDGNMFDVAPKLAEMIDARLHDSE